MALALDSCRLYTSLHMRAPVIQFHRKALVPLLARRNFKDKKHVGGFTVSCQRSFPEEGKLERPQKLRDTSFSKQRDERKKKSFRIRGRLRLVLRAVRRWCSLRALIMYSQSHSKQVTLSTLIGCTMAMGCLCLRLTSIPSPHHVSYSELIGYLRSGTVTAALFEEGSRQVFFNLHKGEAARDSLVINDNSRDAALDNVNSYPTSNLKPLMTTSSIGRIEEDMAKHLQLQSGVVSNEHTAGQMKAESVVSTMEKIDSIDAAEKDATFSKQFLASSAAEKNGRVSALSAATSVFSSSLRAITSAPEMLTKSEPHPWQYSTRRVENDEPYLLQLMRDTGVNYSSAPQPMSSALRTTIITILSLWIPLTPLLWMMYKHLSGGNALSQKRRQSSPNVKFEDVAGVDEAKTELVEIVSYLRGATNFKMLGAKLPKGVLLVGPPGTGKTLLARAVAGEAGVPFFAASASEFVEMFVGRGAARIRDLFNGARKSSPSIIFIDELDAVGGRRGRSFNDERDQTLNQLLTEMDGFESEPGVLVIAATNRPEALDPALCRSGRFSRKVFVKEPDLRGRQQILAVHLRDVPVEGDHDALQNAVAIITSGFVGADLASVVNEAALLAVRAGRPAVSIEDLKEAVARIKYGVGNRPAFASTVERVFDWLQPKSLKSTPSGYEAPSWSG